MLKSTGAVGFICWVILILSASKDVTAFSSSLGSRSTACLPIQRPRHTQSRRAYLAMHWGHSHTHSHDHGRAREQQLVLPTVPNNKGASGWRGRLSSLFRRSRFQISVLFAAMVTILPSLLLERKIQKSNLTLFLATVTALNLFNQLKGSVKTITTKMKLLRDGFVKHTPPQPLWTTSYFLRTENDADRVTFLGIIINIILSAGKAIVGLKCHSTALIADAGHSLSDLFSDFITLWAVQIARLPPDDDHPYGHGKFEAIGSLFLALTLFATGLGVGAVSAENLMRIIAAQRSSGVSAAAHILSDAVPTPPALIMAALSIISKEWLYRITRKVGDELRSQVVIANAWHHRSDAYSSVLALISIGLAIGFPGLLAADSAAGLLVAGVICLTGFEIMGESVRQLTDANDEELVHEVRAIALGESVDVTQVRRLRTRRMGSSSIVQMDIYCPPSLSTSALRAVEQRVRLKVMEGVPGIIDCEVHASSPDAVVCPLLAAAELKDHPTISAHEIEDTATNILYKHPQVQSIQSCTVHYQDTILANVDATIRLKNPENASITQAMRIATDLRATLEKNELIHKANIYLDLNEGTAVLL